MRLVNFSIFQRIVLVLGIIFYGLAFLPHYFSKLATPDNAFVYLMLLECISLISACAAIIMFLFYAILPDPDFKQTCKRWFALTSLLFVLSILIPVSSALLCVTYPFASFVSSFDAQQWKNPASSEHLPGDITVRQKMVGNAVRNHVIGYRKTDIVAALGESEHNGQFPDDLPDLAYRTGPRRDSAFQQGDEWLLIWLDDSQKMLRFEIVAISG